ncbi:uncharacterized protein LOC100845477 [Brachypodium distachyon]|uniref:Uncharacterized protein n=1 Tax=Brachypodium distachyon TaxID=15368 RepID=A0A0Q3IIZ9_BRADI|nr:uncharacterized protein LOC100845477 [Brachypodium distachyon]KQK05771.1 hypothetical protein BRADI_2g22380v3 [Brachypodium distachyon]|eukprot:XP_003566145.3 uncharacterized protein LOC100845477 [Brachypodium distachyon]
MRGREAPRPPGGTETPTSNNNPQMSPLRITHDGEFYARLLTKEIASGGSLGSNPHSFRYYGPGPGPVPFGWESQPGTPKDAPCCRRTLPQAADPAVADVVPAITPPPSYYHLRSAPPNAHSGRMSRSGRKTSKLQGGGSKSKCCYCGCGYGRKLKWSVKIGFIAALFRRIVLGKSRVSSAPSVQSSSSTRWLFSGSSSQEETAGVYDHDYDHYEQPATKGVLRLGLGVRQTPWMVQFCGGRREAGWVHGWP